MRGTESRSFQVEAPDTLLRFLLSHLGDKSRNTVKGLLSRGQVQVDGRRVTAFDVPLAPGAQVTVLPPKGETGGRLPFPVLYEDDALIVIDKPAGLLTVATEREKEKTAYRILKDALGEGRDGLHVVHRLDRDTSGVVLFARSRAWKETLQENWEKLVTLRAYLAVVEGAPPEQRGTVRSFLHENAAHVVYSGAPGNGAKEAVTRYEVLARRGGRSLLRVELDTGRKNQIRVHMADLGCPVAGDRKYGRGRDSLHRLGLHAWKLGLIHPQTGAALEFTAPLPEPLRRLFPEEKR